MAWEKYLERWVDAHLIDPLTADRIREFEHRSDRQRLGLPARLAITFGAIMLCTGTFLFVSSHWDQIAPWQRFTVVLAMVAVFHIAGAVLGEKVPAIGMALHGIGTASLGAGIYLAGQIFNLEEHWPGGLMLWSLGAVLAWLVLRQWPQALLAALLVPAWIAGEWDVATEIYYRSWNIAAQGLLLLALLYISTPSKQSNRRLQMGLISIGSITLLPLLIDVIAASEIGGMGLGSGYKSLPSWLEYVGYIGAYLPILVFAAVTRKKRSLPIFVSAAWINVLVIICGYGSLESNLLLYVWIALAACAFCYWGVHENLRLFINYGIVIFALDLTGFYFSTVLDKLGRSMGLILLGAIFLAGGWVLNRLRTDLIARAAAGAGAN